MIGGTLLGFFILIVVIFIVHNLIGLKTISTYVFEDWTPDYPDCHDELDRMSSDELMALMCDGDQSMEKREYAEYIYNRKFRTNLKARTNGKNNYDSLVSTKNIPDEDHGQV